MKRWPLIRHIRWFYLAYQVERHYAEWLKLGSLPVYRHLDYEVLDKIWRGEL